MSESRFDQLINCIQQSVEDLKGKNYLMLDLVGKASFADAMILVTGTSTRHVKSIAHLIVENAKKEDFQVFGVEGEMDADWVLVDLGDVVVHVMIQDARDFYQLEDLWTQTPAS